MIEQCQGRDHAFYQQTVASFDEMAHHLINQDDYNAPNYYFGNVRRLDRDNLGWEIEANVAHLDGQWLPWPHASTIDVNQSPLLCMQPRHK